MQRNQNPVKSSVKKNIGLIPWPANSMSSLSLGRTGRVDVGYLYSVRHFYSIYTIVMHITAVIYHCLQLNEDVTRFHDI